MTFKHIFSQIYISLNVYIRGNKHHTTILMPMRAWWGWYSSYVIPRNVTRSSPPRDESERTFYLITPIVLAHSDESSEPKIILRLKHNTIKDEVSPWSNGPSATFECRVGDQVRLDVDFFVVNDSFIILFENIELWCVTILNYFLKLNWGFSMFNFCGNLVT